MVKRANILSIKLNISYNCCQSIKVQFSIFPYDLYDTVNWDTNQIKIVYDKSIILLAFVHREINIVYFLRTFCIRPYR